MSEKAQVLPDFVTALAHMLALRDTDRAAVAVALATTEKASALALTAVERANAVALASVERAMTKADAQADARYGEVAELRKDIQNVGKDIVGLFGKMSVYEGTTAGKGQSWMMSTAIVGMAFGLVSSIGLIIMVVRGH
ncbi:MAG TPA: hypothetical protein DEQ40_02575 [Oxalobacteraceae bacterium]|nr:hypothetical protein [Oxalobacteraceae bacterium]